MKAYILIWWSLVSLTYALTGQQWKNSCHCDLIENFCDFNCCCDPTCSNQVGKLCYFELSSQFCVEKAYYYRIQPGLNTTDQEYCFYFNITDSTQQQLEISSAQMSQIVNNKLYIPSLPNQTQEMYEGYTPETDIGIQVSLFDDTGSCVPSGGSINAKKIKYKHNIDVSCAGEDNSIDLFTKFFGQSVNKYYLDDSSKVQIPNPESATYTQAHIYFIIGTYGSSQLQYIQQVKVKTVNKQSSKERRLVLNFLNPSQKVLQVSQPSFFPQIPYDIFFPIQQYFFRSPL